MNHRSHNLEKMDSPDKRYFPRWEVKNDVYYHVGTDEENHQSSTEDISCSGLRMTIDNDVIPNQTINLKVQLSQQVHVDLKGTISWIHEENGKKQIGVHFFNTPQNVQELILDYAFELNSKQITRNWFKGWK